MVRNDGHSRSVYIAGPMTGYVMHNFPAFEAARCELRLRGFVPMYSGQEVTNFSHTWEYYMRKALQMLAKCQCIALLPGWEKSRGATLEQQIAVTLKMPVVKLDQHYQGVREDDQENRN